MSRLVILKAKNLNNTKKWRAFCTSHPSGGWWGDCHANRNAADKDATKHKKDTGHKTVDVVEVDEGECNPPEEVAMI